MYDFCSEEHLPFARCGKLIVATDESELSGLEALQERAAANGVAVELLTAAGAAEREPNVRAVAALGVESAGITDYGAVCRRMAELIASAGGQLLLNHRVEQIRRSGRSYALLTSSGVVRAQHLVALREKVYRDHIGLAEVHLQQVTFDDAESVVELQLFNPILRRFHFLG